MKKVNLILAITAVFAVTFLTSHAQPQTNHLSDQEIWETILLSEEANAANGISDPDMIYPGQILTFNFWDGSRYETMVTQGQSQWQIVKMIDSLSLIHGDVVPPSWGVSTPVQVTPVNSAIPQEEQSRSATEGSTGKESDNTLLWLALFFVAVLLLYAFVVLRQRQQKRYLALSLDPITSGDPMVDGGISPDNPEEVAQRIKEVAATQSGYTLSGIQIISEIEHGLLNGTGEVKYKGNSKSKLRRFTDTPGYRALVRFPDGEEETVFFLQGCGNDVTFEGSWVKNVKFTPQTVVTEAPTEKKEDANAEEEENTKAKETPSTEDSLGNELDFFGLSMFTQAAQATGGKFKITHRGTEIDFDIPSQSKSVTLVALTEVTINPEKDGKKKKKDNDKK